jgi:hypothetical protein
LKSCSRPTWLSFVREHYPALVPDYTRRYATADFTDAAYRGSMATTIRQLCHKHGLAQRSTDALLTRHVHSASSTERKSPTSAPAPAQASLFATA